MSLNKPSYLAATYPPPLSVPTPTPSKPATDLPRLFRLHWNNTKTKRRKSDADEWQQAYGVQFANGYAAIDLGHIYETLSELEATVASSGEHRIEWLDQQEGTA